MFLIFSSLACPTKSHLLPARAQPKHSTSESRGGSQTDRSRLKLPLTSPKLVVKKSARRLLLYSGKELVRTYRVGLGLSPVGDKVREGDRRTPEGDSYIYIHGNGAQSDWTCGCVALENKDIHELFDVVKVGMTVTIEP